MKDDELIKSLQMLTRYEKKLSSLSWNFLRGIFYGFGFFIGSAILAGVLILILSKIEGWAYVGNYVHNIMELIRQN